MTTKADREIVEIATPGPWKKPFKHSGSVYDEKEENCIVGGYHADITEEDAKFIAHFNPAKVFDMLNRIEELEAKLSRIEHAVAPGSGNLHRGKVDFIPTSIVRKLIK